MVQMFLLALSVHVSAGPVQAYSRLPCYPELVGWWISHDDGGWSVLSTPGPGRKLLPATAKTSLLSRAGRTVNNPQAGQLGRPQAPDTSCSRLQQRSPCSWELVGWWRLRRWWRWGRSSAWSTPDPGHTLLRTCSWELVGWWRLRRWWRWGRSSAWSTPGPGHTPPRATAKKSFKTFWDNR